MNRQMYRFVNANRIEAYDGRVLKRFENGKLVKVAANPTDEMLIEFDYLPLETTEQPETDEGHIAVKSYELDTSGLNPTIREKWEMQEAEILGETICGPNGDTPERATGIAEETNDNEEETNDNEEETNDNEEETNDNSSEETTDENTITDGTGVENITGDDDLLLRPRRNP